MLGEKFDSIEMDKYTHSLGKFEIEKGIPAYPHYMYFDAGVEIVLEKASYEVYAIFLMGEGQKWYKPFKGKLPYGIQMSDTRAQVEAKIGVGKRRSFGDKVVIQYTTKNLEIAYNTEDENDKQARIATVQVRTFD
jgi:hypothetical protein